MAQDFTDFPQASQTLPPPQAPPQGGGQAPAPAPQAQGGQGGGVPQAITQKISQGASKDIFQKLQGSLKSINTLQALQKAVRAGVITPEQYMTLVGQMPEVAKSKEGKELLGKGQKALLLAGKLSRMAGNLLQPPSQYYASQAKAQEDARKEQSEGRKLAQEHTNRLEENRATQKSEDERERMRQQGEKEREEIRQRGETEHQRMKDSAKPPPAPKKEISDIPGKKILEGNPEARDAFGAKVDENFNYQESTDGKLYPQKPKEEKYPAGELGERMRAEDILQNPLSSPTQKKAASSTLKHLDEVGKALQVRIDSAQRDQNSSALVSDDDLKVMARRELATGAKPSWGLGKSALRDRYNKIMAVVLREDPDSQTAIASFKAGTANLTQLQRTRGQVGAFESMFQYDLKNAREASANVPRTSMKKINTWEQLLQAEFSDNPELAKLSVAAQTVVNQYASLMSNFRGATSDTARAEATGLISKAMASGSFEGALSQMEKEAKNRAKGLDDEIASAQKGMKSVLGPPPKASEAPKNEKDPLGIL